ncbi:DUF7537 family lipoprotein [Halosimplex salinum]|uniref:DUF7537 family lipoprotein n=1 Tax=Halosimplex salinum TaxID=1710538 RepID=UPI000F494621|nr:hypothetical protein [Halosimplex salinum]
MSSRGGRLLIVVAALALLAGCSAFAVGEESTPRETLTPAPVPDDGVGETATPSSTTDAFGAYSSISATGSVDADRLYASHINYLSSRSYTVGWERRTAGGSGPITREYRRHVAVQDDETYLRRAEGSASDNETLTYATPEGTYRRVLGPDGTTVSRVVPRNTGPARERFAKTITFEALAFLRSGYDEIDVVERDGRHYARVISEHPPTQIVETYAAYAVHDFTATVWIAPEGYVRAIHYEFDLINVDERIAVEWRYDYTDVGKTTVERPAWVPGTATDAGPAGTNGTAAPSERAPGTATPTADPSRVPPPTAVNVTTAD